MLGWAIGFFVAALVAAVFGFGGIASAFSGLAVLLFWVFLALFILSILFNTFGGAHAASHSGSGRTFATVALVAAVALGVYAWVDNDMSAERVGRTIDRETAQLAENTSDAIATASNRAGDVVEETSDDIEADLEAADERAETATN